MLLKIYTEVFISWDSPVCSRISKSLVPISKYQWFPPPQMTKAKKLPHIFKCPPQVLLLLKNSSNHECTIGFAGQGRLMIPR